MKKLKIYIDFVGEDESKVFGLDLKEKLKSIKEDFHLWSFENLPGDGEDWEIQTVKAIEKSDIIIPILNTNYLSFVTDSIASTFDDIIDSDNRYLFPILLSQCQWGSFNWIVRSRLTPSEGVPLTELSTQDRNRIINELIKIVRDIITKNKAQHANGIKQKDKAININDKIVFISHDHDDADFAELLKMKLEKNGLIGWIDSERLKIGQDWREEIDQGIENSIAVIAVMTPDSRKSEYVTYEWAFAWGKGKKVFPIMLKQTQLHPRLESLQYLDFTNRPNRPWGKLINSIKELL